MQMLLGEKPTAQEEKSMAEYGETYFNLNRKGLFGKRTEMSKLLSWKADVIRTSLRLLPKDLAAQTVQTFRNITGFMGDRSTGKEKGGHAYKLLKATLHAPEELRDEVYCQLVKQTTNNDNLDSNLKGWQLMAICCGAFPPSNDFEPYLRSYLQKHREKPDNVGSYAEYCLRCLIKSQSLGVRRETPTSIEVEAVRALKPVILRVFHLDDNYSAMPVMPWTTAKDLRAMMANKLGVADGEPFSIFEMNQDGEERCLETDERILDLLGYWQRVFNEGTSKEKKENPDTYRFVYKVRMYFDPAEDDIEAVHQMYVQAVYDVVSQRYPCSEEDAMKLAALQIQRECGDAGNPKLEEDLDHYAGEKFLSVEKKSGTLVQIKTMHAGLSGMSPQEAQKQYLQFVCEWQIYGSSFFFVEPQMSAILPEEVFLAVNPRGILVINPGSKEVLADHPYAEVPTWGHSGTSFVLHIGNLIKQTKLYFKTEQGKEINELVRAYVNHLCVK
jgi:myosin-7